MYEPDYTTILREYRKWVNSNQKWIDRIDQRYLPCQEYHAYDRWQPPGGIKTLFLAESPPWSSRENYFYNERYEPPQGKRNLRTILFDKLDIETGVARQGLKEFKGSDYFLSDSVKCVFKKTLPYSSATTKKKKKRIPRDLIRHSVDTILRDEIACMNPRIIFVLGSTALKALRYIEEFSPKLEGVSIKGDCGNLIEVGNGYIVICAFLNAQNMKTYEEGIEQAFEELAALL